MGRGHLVTPIYGDYASLVAQIAALQTEEAFPLYASSSPRVASAIGLYAKWNPDAAGGSGAVEIVGEVDFTKLEAADFSATEIVEINSPTVAWSSGLQLSGGAVRMPFLPGSLGATVPQTIVCTAILAITDSGSPTAGDNVGVGWVNGSDALAGSGVWYDGTDTRWEGALYQGTLTTPVQGGAIQNLGTADINATIARFQIACTPLSATTGHRFASSYSEDWGTGVTNDSSITGAISTHLLGASGPITALAFVCMGANIVATLKRIAYKVVI